MSERAERKALAEPPTGPALREGRKLVSSQREPFWKEREVVASRSQCVEALGVSFRPVYSILGQRSGVPVVTSNWTTSAKSFNFSGPLWPYLERGGTELDVLYF